MDPKNNPRQRYSRQTVFPEIGEEGQEKISRGSVALIGCGALGCNIANLLVRAGIGKIRIIDRDFVEYHNLQRQVLFDEEDVKKEMFKVLAARNRLSAINQFVHIEPVIADINQSNVERYCQDVDIIIDGLDNIETRYLLNDVSLKLKRPYIYGGAIGSTGMTMTFIPGKTPCFRCVFPNMPPQKALPTCETAGVLNSIPAIIGALEANEAIKLLVGSDSLNTSLLSIDIWSMSFNQLKVQPRTDCPACNGRYDFLNRKLGLVVQTLCGQSRAIQLFDHNLCDFNLHLLAARLPVRKLFQNEYMVRFDIMDCEMLIFHDGRAIVRNTLDENVAVELYQKYVLSLFPNAEEIEKAERN